MSDRQSRPGRVLSPREREFIRNRQRANEEILRGHIVVATNRATHDIPIDQRRLGRMEEFIDPTVGEDRRALVAKIKADQKLLDEGGPQPITRRERPRIEKRVEENREWLRSHMCPASLYYLKADHPDFAKAKAAAGQEHEPEYKRRAEQFKQDMRRLDPDNHDASNLERIRPQS